MWSFQSAFFHSSQGYVVLKQKTQKLRFIFRNWPSDVTDQDADYSDYPAYTSCTLPSMCYKNVQQNRILDCKCFLLR